MNRTKVDWWAWRSQGSPGAHQAALSQAFGQDVALVPRGRGFLGYEQSAQIRVKDLDCGLVAWGGANQRDWTYSALTGVGCGWVEDWDLAQEAASELPGYSPRRVDIALDTFDGSTGFDQTLAAYRAGGFSPPGSGRPPKCEPMKPEREEDSAIIRIGNRQANKYLRGYEKGKQLVGPALMASVRRSEDGQPDWPEFMTMRLPMQMDGEVRMVPIWEWWRLELELKPQTAELPEDVIDRRDQYFAGAYPYLGQVLQGVDSEALVMRRERGPQLQLAMALETMRRQWGNTLFTALVAKHGDIGWVWSRIVGRKHNQVLVDAGVLMVDHEEQ